MKSKLRNCLWATHATPSLENAFWGPRSDAVWLKKMDREEGAPPHWNQPTCHLTFLAPNDSCRRSDTPDEKLLPGPQEKPRAAHDDRGRRRYQKLHTGHHLLLLGSSNSVSIARGACPPCFLLFFFFMNPDPERLSHGHFSGIALPPALFARTTVTNNRPNFF